MAPRVLVTGASGYVGGRLVPALLAAGARVRAGGRDPDALAERTWGDDVERVELDLLDEDLVRSALTDVDAVVFLVHAMGGGDGFAEREARMARILAREAADAGVGRIVYLSGLHPDLPEEELSEHMASRERVARILGDGAVPTLTLRAATLIGGGSASFEIIRHLADRLPVMPAPSWVTNRIEPLAIDDALHYLVAGTLVPEPIDGAYDVGSGETHLRFADLLVQYAEVAGLGRRVVLPLPVPAPRLSGLWITLVTPCPHTIAMPLAESMQHEAVSTGRPVTDVLDPPAGGATPYRWAVVAALEPARSGSLAEIEDPRCAEALGPSAVHPADPAWAGPTRRQIAHGLDAAPDAVADLMRRLLAEDRDFARALAGSRVRWTVQDDAEDGAWAAHADDAREGRVHLAVDGEGDRARVRLVAAPRGILGTLLWGARRSRRAAALRAISVALTGAPGDRGTGG